MCKVAVIYHSTYGHAKLQAEAVLRGAFTNSMSFSGDRLNTLVGLFINAMQHGMIYVGLGMKRFLTGLTVGLLQLGCAASALAAVETYDMDPAHSWVGFSVRHLFTQRRDFGITVDQGPVGNEVSVVIHLEADRRAPAAAQAAPAAPQKRSTK